ncbi:MFS transporter [Aquipuribacter sp. MA13-6]|uniref:MFS transporter n=1 Tax=unclassified Aquipuribacter TaxID=2635084 RepID=UPI003EE9195F
MPGTVVGLGVVSLLTDVSSESVAAVLPLYLTVVVGLSPFAYGVVDGLYQGVSAAARVPAGWLSDRLDRPKWIALVGYGLSALTKVLLLPAAGFAAITAVIAADRVGKGLRTSPRDAMISMSSDPADLGRNFGVHRAMDTVGAMLGPLLAFVLLAVVPGGYDLVFLVSFVVALLGLSVLGLVVPDQRRRTRGTTPATPPAQTAPSTSTVPGPREPRPARPRLRDLGGPAFLRLCLVAGGLGLLTVSDGFLYLVLQEREGFAAQWFPLLFVVTSLTYLALAVPLGRLSDRVGRARVFVAGHVALLLAYLAAAGPLDGPLIGGAALLLLGTYYAATDGVVAALAARLTPTHLRASGIATVQTVVVLARLGSSLVFGLLWTAFGSGPAVLVMAVGLTLALVPAWFVVRSSDRVETPV